MPTPPKPFFLLINGGGPEACVIEITGWNYCDHCAVWSRPFAYKCYKCKR